jgi:hypothetical protein
MLSKFHSNYLLPIKLISPEMSFLLHKKISITWDHNNGATDPESRETSVILSLHPHHPELAKEPVFQHHRHCEESRPQEALKDKCPWGKAIQLYFHIPHRTQNITSLRDDYPPYQGGMKEGSTIT